MTDNLGEYLAQRPNIERYMNYMNSSLGDKLEHILPFIEADVVSPRILSIGAGTGILERALVDLMPQSRVIGLDLSMPMLEAINGNNYSSQIEGASRVEPLLASAENIPLQDESVDYIILSSVVHEIASYQHDFQFGEELKEFYQEASRVLKKGGRIIIRDFMQPPNPQDKVTMRIGERREDDEIDPSEFLERFVNEFEGDDLVYLQEQIKMLKDNGAWGKGADLKIRADHAFEVAAHYSWSKSFDEEVKEKYAYLPVDEYAQFVTSALGENGVSSKVLRAKTYMQSGYADHIQGRLDLMNGDGTPKPLPDFTGVVVIEKS